MRDLDHAVNLTGMSRAGARAWSVQTRAAANPCLMAGGYRGFDFIESTHKATVRPAGLPEGSTG